MVIVDAPPPPIHYHEVERDGCVGEGMFDYCGCGHLVRIFVIGTIARRKVNVRSQFAAGIMFRFTAYRVFISLNHECLHLNFTSTTDF